MSCVHRVSTTWLARAVRTSARIVLVAAGVAGAACYRQVPVAPAALSSSRQYVQVRFATPQRVRLSGPGRDMLLDGVTTLEGWTNGIRGDTLLLQVARWAAHEHVRDLEPSEYIATIAPAVGATIEARRRDMAGSILLGALVVVVVVGAAAFLYLYGNYEG